MRRIGDAGTAAAIHPVPQEDAVPKPAATLGTAGKLSLKATAKFSALAL